MVDDWLLRFATEHLLRHGGAGLPPLDTEAGCLWYEALRENFVKRGVHDYEVATLASMRLAGVKLRHSSEHLATLVELALEEYRARRPAGVGADGREAALAASKGCPECDGSGIAARFRHHGPEAGRAVLLGCVCPAGRWLLRAKAAGQVKGDRRYADLRQYPFLLGPEGLPYHAPPRPAGAPDRAPAFDSAEGWRAHKAALAAALRHDRPAPRPAPAAPPPPRDTIEGDPILARGWPRAGREEAPGATLA